MLKFRSLVSAAVVQLRDLREAPLSRDPLPSVPPAMARAVVVSFYMPNISRRVVAAQRRVLKRFVPSDVAIEQVMTWKKHEHAINDFISNTPYGVVVVLDIDCIPIDGGAVDRLIADAEKGLLVGAAQRANHIDNGGHLYAAPCCLAISIETYRRLGKPLFDSTKRGDVAEELTYAAEERGVPVKLLWPTSSEDHVWQLTETVTYGHGTIYERAFWHAFQIRFREHQDNFVRRCQEFLSA